MNHVTGEPRVTRQGWAGQNAAAGDGQCSLSDPVCLCERVILNSRNYNVILSPVTEIILVKNQLVTKQGYELLLALLLKCKAFSRTFICFLHTILYQ